MPLRAVTKFLELHSLQLQREAVFQEATADDVGSTITDLGNSASQVGVNDVAMTSWDGLEEEALLSDLGHTPEDVYTLFDRAKRGDLSDPHDLKMMDHYLNVPGIDQWFLERQAEKEQEERERRRRIEDRRKTEYGKFGENARCM